MGEPLGNGVVNIPEIYTSEPGNVGLPSRWKVHGFNANVKALRGNNGNFDMLNPNIYKILFPAMFGTGFVGKTMINNSNNK